jgi:hypothetical protein
MSGLADLSTLSGLEQLRAIFAGATGYKGIVRTLDLRPISAEEGSVTLGANATNFETYLRGPSSARLIVTA